MGNKMEPRNNICSNIVMALWNLTWNKRQYLLCVKTVDPETEMKL
jgi:hypothetical protein